MSIVVTVNRDQFVLRDAETISRVRREITDAVRAGGGLVTVGDVASGPELLIPPATHVRIAILTEPDDEAHEAVEFIDFDHYGPSAP
jgi:hypothetical protein